MACEVCKKLYVPATDDSLFDSDGKPHVCNTCGKSFSLKIQLKRHMLTHEDGMPYVCNACEKQDKQAHSMTLSKKGYDHMCEKCNETFRTKRMLLKHTCEHTSVDSGEWEEGLLNVNKSNKNLSSNQSKKVLTGNKAGENHSPKPYQCWDCNKSFAHMLSFKKHSQSHKKQKCASCNASFTSKEGLDNHHSGGCSKDTSLSGDAGDKKHVCSICNKSFTRKSALEGHVISHLAEKTESGCEDDSDKDADFLCDIKVKCEKTAKQSSEMCLPKLKIRRSYSCEICHKACSSKKALEKHLLLHNTVSLDPTANMKPSIDEIDEELRKTVHIVEEKKYVCRICNEIFLVKNDYKKHKLSHVPKTDGETNTDMKELKTYVCKVCTEVFNKKKHLKKHYFKTHSSNTDKLQKVSSTKTNKNSRKKQKRSKDLACKICGKLFAGETCLKKHEARHSTDAPEAPAPKEKRGKPPQTLICPFCDENFTGRRFAFVRHKLSHTPEVCGICDARFVDRLCLREHLKSHIGSEEAKRFLECSQRSNMKNNTQNPEAKVEYIYLVLR